MWSFQRLLPRLRAPGLALAAALALAAPARAEVLTLTCTFDDSAGPYVLSVDTDLQTVTVISNRGDPHPALISDTEIRWPYPTAPEKPRGRIDRITGVIFTQSVDSGQTTRREGACRRGPARAF